MEKAPSLKKIKLTKTNVHSNNRALKYLWARHRLKSLSDYVKIDERMEKELKNDITNLGLKYNLLTKYTSFIAVDEKIRNPKEGAQTVKQPLPLPEGVSNKAIGKSNRTPLPPVIEEIPEEELLEEEASELVDMSMEIEEDLEIEPPRTGIPPPPPPPPTEPQTEEIFKVVESMPLFPGCENAKPSSYQQNCSREQFSQIYLQQS